ncbi:MAG TPA: response regulator transcription factor [Chthoniobacterales bacterium]|nr:response regulator transcription factor [Chthoniobacterales bacterium]
MRSVKKAASKTSPAAKKKRTILLVDDHPLFRRGMAQLLDGQSDLVVRAEAENSGGALDAVRREHFDLAVVDIGLRGGANGIELMKFIKAERPELPVLMVSMYDEALYAERALRAGARGYVMKREALDCVLGAVRSVLDGEIYISPTMSKRMIFDHIHSSGEARTAVERLSDRELEVFQLIGEGQDMHEIARNLHLSKKTVEAHRSNIKEKLGVMSARDVVRYATQWVGQQR